MPLRGEKNFRPRPENRTLVSLKSFFKISEEHRCLFLDGSPPGSESSTAMLKTFPFSNVLSFCAYICRQEFRWQQRLYIWPIRNQILFCFGVKGYRKVRLLITSQSDRAYSYGDI